MFSKPQRLLIVMGVAAIAIVIFMINNSGEAEIAEKDLTSEINKDGAVESHITVTHINDNQDVLITSHKVWFNKTEFKNVLYYDTIPSLGLQITTAENEDGDAKSVDVKKDYEVFITVK
jgi:hypothetical protein